MNVVHEGYEAEDTYLHFIDSAKLPFGLDSWNHHHIVEVKDDNVIISDRFRIRSESRAKLFYISYYDFPNSNQKNYLQNLVL